ncbi:MAG: hypothetical protein JXR68_03665 [Bacteroidales bacterium]|nr:hypothetical protein [Bacteroidales bacterium]
MKIIEIRKNELLNFLETDLYKKSENIPITRSRALSQVNNPRAQENDVLLIIAVNDNEQIIGYIGALPDKITDFPEIKTAWNSCWWTDKSASAKGALSLFFAFLKAYNNNIMMRDLTEVTKTIIKSLKKFTVIKELNAKKFFFRLNLAQKLPKYKLLLKTFDLSINFIINLKLNIFNSKKLKNLNTEYITELTKEDEIFISSINTNEAFKRNVNEINWIIKNPWIEEGTTKDDFQKRYYFSSVKKTFSNKILRVINNKNKTIAIIFFTEIEGTLEIPYIYYKKENVKTIGQIILNHIIKYKILSFFTFNNDLCNWFKTRKNTYFYSKSYKKEFIVSNSLSKYFKKDLVFQDGEGDYAFA